MEEWLARWLDDLNNYPDLEMLSWRVLGGPGPPCVAVAHVNLKGKEYVLTATPTDL